MALANPVPQQELTRTGQPVTPWGPILGVLLSVALNLVAAMGYVRFREYSGFTDHFNTIGVVFVLFLLCWPVAGAVRWLFRRTLGTADRALVYFCLMLATVVPTMGFCGYLLPLISGVSYYATGENRWQALLVGRLTPWLITRPGKPVAWFYEGLPPGKSVPWDLWTTPLLFWGLFFVVLSLVSLAMMVLLRRQWQEHEHLAYPLTALPLELVGAAPDRKLPLYRNGLFWMGFALALPFASYNAVARLLSLTGVAALKPTMFRVSFRMFRQSMSGMLSFDPLVLGLSYLVTVDVLLSVWVFFWIAFCCVGLLNILGVPPGAAFPHAAGGALFAPLQTGAVFFLAGAALWTARAHLRDAWRGHAKDDDEIAPYRLAWAMALGGFVVLWYLLTLTGLSIPVAGLLLGLAFAFYLGTTLLLAQTGMGRLRAPNAAGSMLTQLVGSANLSGNQMAALGLSFIWSGDLQLFTMGTSAMGLRVWHEARPERPRWALPAGIVTLILSLFAACIAYLAFGYRYGAHSGYGWYFSGSPMVVWNWTASQIQNPTQASSGALALMAVGAVLTCIVATLHKVYFWWPLHPAGLAISLINTTQIDWFSMFLAWLVKVTILHYAGPRAFRISLPLFLGMIAGSVVGASGSFLLGMLTA